jgi:hypothetical protein
LSAISPEFAVQRSRRREKLRAIIVLLFAAFLTACAYQSPPRTDPLADLLGGLKVVDSPERAIPESKKKRLALIVSTSSETQIKAREEGHKMYLDYVRGHKSDRYQAVKELQESVGPRLLIETAVAELRKRFGSVTVVSDLAAFREQGYDYAAVFDIGMEASGSSTPMKNAAEYTTDIALIFFDRQIRRIGLAQGKATETGERSNAGDMAKALLLFVPDTNVDEVMQPLIQAERKSRIAAFLKLGTALDALIR